MMRWLTRRLMLGGAAAIGGSLLAGRWLSAEGFENRYPVPVPSGFGRWLLSQAKAAPAPSADEFDRTRPVAQLVRDTNISPPWRMTWLGHATVLLEIAGQRLLFDPHFGSRSSPVSFAGPERLQPLPWAVGDLPPIGGVFISHNHYDHLDIETVQALLTRFGSALPFFVPARLGGWFSQAAVVQELGWWQSSQFAGARITFVPVQHESGRGLTDRNQTLWGAWAIEASGNRILICCDAGYSADFRDIRERLGRFDAAALPIGDYVPEAYHMTPEKAVQAKRDLGDPEALAIHWGTFRMTDFPVLEPAIRLAAAQQRVGGAPFHLLRPGESMVPTPRLPAPASLEEPAATLSPRPRESPL